jgi:hypothetical protein
MSQVSFKVFKDGEELQVVAGWDYPLQTYFLTVFDNDDDVVWATLDHPSVMDCHSTDRLSKQLTSMGVDVPAEFWERVQRKERNVIHSYVAGIWGEQEV